MTIKIAKKGNGYVAKVTPPHGGNNSWEVTEPQEVDTLVQKLLDIGCHQTDIGDALYEIDPKLIGISE
jgi:hypothetical protein